MPPIFSAFLTVYEALVSHGLQWRRGEGIIRLVAAYPLDPEVMWHGTSQRKDEKCRLGYQFYPQICHFKANQGKLPESNRDLISNDRCETTTRRGWQLWWMLLPMGPRPIQQPYIGSMNYALLVLFELTDVHFCFDSYVLGVFNQNPGEVFVSVAFPSQTLLAPPLMCRHHACSLHHGMTGMTLLPNFSRGIKVKPLDVPVNMPEGDAAGFGTRLQDCVKKRVSDQVTQRMDVKIRKSMDIEPWTSDI